MRKITLFFAVALLLASCTPTSVAPIRPNYQISLESVKKPSDSKHQYGNPIAIKTDSSYFEDEFVGIRLVVDYNNIGIELRNLSLHTIEILWDRAVYVNRYQICGRIIHSGIKFKDKEYSQVSSYIPSGARLFDILVPAFAASYTETNTSYSIYNPILPLSTSYLVNEYKEYAHDILPSFRNENEIKNSGIIGSVFSIVLPIVIEDVINEYTFTFRITNVDLNVHTNTHTNTKIYY